MSKILITGGCGFIGSHIVDKLIIEGFDVYVIDLEYKYMNNLAKYYIADINNIKKIDDIFKDIKPEFCIHLAGILGTTETWNYPEKTILTNIIGSNNIYEICGKYKCNIITVDVGSKWLSPYTITKTCSADFALAYANKYDIKCGLLRIFNVYGPRQSTKIIKIVPIFIYNSLKDDILEIWGNKNVDLIYVTDVADAFYKAIINIDKINKRRDIYIGSGNQILTYDFANIIIKKIGKGSIKICDCRLGEENIDNGYMNNNKAEELLEWKPIINLDDGINLTIDYYNESNIISNYGKL